jgi:hypothetical protein
MASSNWPRPSKTLVLTSMQWNSATSFARDATRGGHPRRVAPDGGSLTVALDILPAARCVWSRRPRSESSSGWQTLAEQRADHAAFVSSAH